MAKIDFDLKIEDLDLYTEDGFWYGMAHTAYLYGKTDHSGWVIDRIEIEGWKSLDPADERKIVMVIPGTSGQARHIRAHWGKYVQEMVDEAAAYELEH